MTAQAQEPIDALFDRNMDVFREHFPAVAARLEQISERICTRVPAPDDNISIDGTLLYPTNAAEWVRLQMEGVDQFGERILVPVAYSNLSAIGRPLLDDFLGFCRDHQYQIASQRIHEVGFHLVFGIGLGLHVPQLLEQTTARRLVLIEPVPEFLLLSMEVVDWAAIFQAAEERRVALQFILYEKPAEIARAIEHEVIFHGRPFLDGTYCYFHYYSWVLREAYSTFREGQRHIELNTGFYEDEMVMMSNAFGNFANNAFHQLAGKRYVEQKVPLFVCGSGPSLRATIPEIQKWRDHVVVMSCGTSLGPLLEAGIRPDLHCEIENVEMVYDILSGLEGKHGFQGITLVASSTVQPNVPPLFERTWFYQRGALTASTILAPDVPSVKGVDPLVSNAAFSVGATLGFRTVYLIGADCGARRKDDHHVKGAYKFESEEEKAKHDKMWADRFDREVPGNFGGKVYSAWHLDLSRRMFEEAQAS
ncbi:MAG TPA: 6-hydroxymethylpterin diphosphokinase MptE-like protein, partial [Magnetospirillum sp.]|nr:6-hydroxymethylpterin diphosphokinase MptE-like protein [Magnetospirillum sp.]